MIYQHYIDSNTQYTSQNKRHPSRCRSIIFRHYIIIEYEYINSYFVLFDLTVEKYVDRKKHQNDKENSSKINKEKTFHLKISKLQTLCPVYDTKQYLIVRNPKECEVPLYCYNTLVHSDLKELYMLIAWSQGVFFQSSIWLFF